jgi:hypothetical protein
VRFTSDGDDLFFDPVYLSKFETYSVVVADSDLHVQTGLTLNFTYRKDQSRYIFKGIETAHF